ncbi:hypothetical protein OH492_21845 [Vibrio chagasii]|nr:hypothetical protein [Vibrio chagasii]
MACAVYPIFVLVDNDRIAATSSGRETAVLIRGISMNAVLAIEASSMMIPA